MKSLFVIALVIFGGCTVKAPEATDNSKPGDSRSTQPITIGNDDIGAISAVCSAMNEKMYVLDDYVSHRELVRVSSQESDCDGKLSHEITEDVRVIKNGSDYAFQNDSNNFRLPEVETLNSGTMKEICTALNIGPLNNPLITGTRTAVEIIVADSDICQKDSQHVCVHVLRGPVSSDGTTFTVSDTTTLKFRTIGDHRGFYVFKNQKNFSTCTKGKFRTKIANFF